MAAAAGSAKRTAQIHTASGVAGLAPSFKSGRGGAGAVSTDGAGAVEGVARTTGSSIGSRSPRWASATTEPQQSVRTTKTPTQIGANRAGDRDQRPERRPTGLTVEHAARRC